MIDIDDNYIKNEVNRCFNCKVDHCSEDCIVGLKPRKFIALYKDNKIEEAINYLYSINPFAETCGYLCPKTFCMKSCIQNKLMLGGGSIDIRAIQAKILKNNTFSYNGYDNIPLRSETINIIGGGVCGLSAAWRALMLGYKVNIYESSDKLGGKMNLIPDFRFNFDIFKKEVNGILNTDRVKVHLNSKKTFSDFSNEDYVINSTIKSNPKKIDVVGNKNTLTYDQFLDKDYLERLKTSIRPIMHNILIVGGGEIAADCALMARDTILEPGCNIYMLVRRHICDMKISEDTLLELYRKKIRILPTSSIVEITGDLNAQKRTVYINRGVMRFNDISTHCNPKLDDPIDFIKADLIISAIGDNIHANNICTYYHKINLMTYNKTIPEAIKNGINLTDMLHKYVK